MTETKEKSTFRCLSPKEIGDFVAQLRKAKDMKQYALAYNAGITERTLQRVEGGERACDDTLRKIAKALGLPEDAFVGPRYVLSYEEATTHLEKMFCEYRTIEGKAFDTIRDCEDAAIGAHAYLIDDRETPTELAREIALFMDLFRDTTDSYKHLSHTERLEACEEVIQQARSIKDLGYCIHYAVYTSDDEFRVICFRVAPGNEYVETKPLFWVPRHMEDSLERAC